MTRTATEEDVRTKIVYPFLRRMGVNLDEIYLEKNIKIRLGQQEKDLRGRIDILVKNKADENLIVFEVKNPSHKLNNNDIEQGLSYAKLISGNIAPITVITNGIDTLVYDTIEYKRITDLSIDFINYSDINLPSSTTKKLRNEALSILIEQEQTELFNEFFNDYLSNNLVPLVGQFDSAKKYSKDLYVSLNKDISEIENIDNKQIFLVSGAPQTGKTNYLIHNALRINFELKDHTIFLSAYNLASVSLAEEIQKAFNSFYGFKHIDHRYLFKQICKSKKIYLFIDGLNEVSNKNRGLILKDLSHYANQGIRIVISCTDTFVTSLRYDMNDNPTIFGDNDLRESRALIPLKTITNVDIEKLYSIYASTFNVILKKNHKRITNPYLLRLAMEIYKNNTMPLLIETNQVLKESLKNKCNIIDREMDVNSYKILEKFAIMTLDHTLPIEESLFCSLLGTSRFSRCPEAYISYGLLDKSSLYSSSINFYYDSIRDFLISEQMFDHNPSSMSENLKKIVSYRNKDIVNSVIYSYLIRNNISYSSIESLNPIDIYRAINSISQLFFHQEGHSSSEIQHYLNTLESFYIDDDFDNQVFYVELESLISQEIRFDINQFSGVISKLFGYYIEGNEFSSAHNLLQSSIFEYFIPPPVTDGICFHQFLTLLLSAGCPGYFQEENDVIIDLTSDLRNSRNSFLDKNEVFVISKLVDEMVEEIYNGVALLCSRPSYLETIRDDFEKSDIDEHISNLTQLRNEINSQQTYYIDDILKELSSLSNTIEITIE